MQASHTFFWYYRQIVLKGVAWEEEGALVRCRVDHSLPYNTKVKNIWSNISISPIRLHDMYMAKLAFFIIQAFSIPQCEELR
jgi:hypothetical protein